METRFEFKDFAKVFAFGILLYAGVFGTIAYFPGFYKWIDGLHPALGFSISYLIQIFIIFFPLSILVIRKYGATLADFGLVKVSFWRWLFTIIGTYIFYIVISLGISTFLYTTETELPGYQAQDSHIPLFGIDTLGLSLAPFFIVLLAPFLEEIFFRGFVYRIFTKTWPIWFASITSALFFALFHFEFKSFIPLFILGILLNFTYQRTQSLWTSFGFHAMNNAIAFAFELYLYYNPQALDFISAAIMPW